MSVLIYMACRLYSKTAYIFIHNTGRRDDPVYHCYLSVIVCSVLITALCTTNGVFSAKNCNFAMHNTYRESVWHFAHSMMKQPRRLTDQVHLLTFRIIHQSMGKTLAHSHPHRTTLVLSGNTRYSLKIYSVISVHCLHTHTHVINIDCKYTVTICKYCTSTTIKCSVFSIAWQITNLVNLSLTITLMELILFKTHLFPTTIWQILTRITIKKLHELFNSCFLV